MTSAAPLPQLSGASNFRALPHVRQGLLYRSDHLGALDEQDAARILELGIRRVLDFRGVDERTSAACTLPGVAVHSLAIEPTVVQVVARLLEAGQHVTPEDMAGHMQDTYRGFVRQNTHRFAEFFGHLLASNEPTVFHCTAGKDRTGFAAALLLYSLDVPQAEVMRDYLVTNDRLKMRVVASGRLPPEAAAVLWRVQPGFLEAALQAVDADYGGMDAYLRKGLGLRDAERKRLRELYLP